MAGLPAHFSENLPSHLKNSLEATKCEYRRLGNSGLKVSVPILGAMGFGNRQWMDWVMEEEKVVTAMLEKRSVKMQFAQSLDRHYRF